MDQSETIKTSIDNNTYQDWISHGSQWNEEKGIPIFNFKCPSPGDLDFMMGMIAGMLYLGVMLVAFAPILCVIIVVAAGAMIYLRFRDTQFHIFHPMYSMKKPATNALSDPPPEYAIALTMPTGGNRDPPIV